MLAEGTETRVYLALSSVESNELHPLLAAAPSSIGTGIVEAGDQREGAREASGLGLWFESNRTGSESYDIYFAIRPALDRAFAVPERVDSLNSVATDSDPWISSDLRHVVFVSNRSGNYELYEASR